MPNELLLGICTFPPEYLAGVTVESVWKKPDSHCQNEYFVKDILHSQETIHISLSASFGGFLTPSQADI